MAAPPQVEARALSPPHLIGRKQRGSSAASTMSLSRHAASAQGRPESMPLRQFDGHVFGAVDKNKLAVVKIHHVVADLDAGGGELGDLGFQVVDGETDVIESDLVELGDVGVGDHLRMTIGQKLHLCVRVLDRQCDMVGLDALDAPCSLP
jgi:hypothetical protein